MKKAIACLLTIAIIISAVPFAIMADGGVAKTEDTLDILAANILSSDTSDAFSKAEVKAKINGANVDFKVDLAVKDDYISSNVDLKPTVKVSLNLAVNNITIPAASEVYFYMPQDLYNSSNEKIAVGEIIRQDDTHIKIEITFEEAIYEMQGVTAGMDFSLARANDDVNKTPSIALADNGNGVTANLTYLDKPLPTVDQDEYYTVEKAVSERSETDPNIEYTITANALTSITKDGQAVPAPVGTYLDGMTITDVVPTGLEVLGVYLNGSATALTGAGDGYNLNGNKITYVVQGTNVTSAVLTVKTALAGSEYASLCSSKTDNTFNNSASLTKAGETTSFKTSQNTPATYKGSEFMTKTGERVGVNGKIYEWTVTGNTYCSGGNVWLVDHIYDKSVHNYVGASAGTVSYTLNATSGTAAKYSGAWTAKAYTALTTDDLNTLTSSHTNAVYYECGNDVILIVPVPSSALNGQFTVKYKTEVTEGTFSANTHKLKNEAKMLWTSLSYGTGPSIIDQFDYSIGKETSANYQLATKSGGDYNAETQELTWKFVVNQCGENLSDIKITDIWNSDSMHLSGVKYQYSGGSETAMGTASGTAPYYSITENNDGQLLGADGNPTGNTVKCDTLTVNCGTVDAAKTLTIFVTVKVLDPAILAVQGSPTISNNAKIEAKVNGGDLQNVTLTASKEINNTLIEKEATGSYDYTDHSLDWTITVNPNALPIKNGVIEDTLPDGLEFKEILSVTAYMAGLINDDNAITGTIHENYISFSGAQVELSYSEATGNLRFELKQGDTPVNTNACPYKFVIKYKTTVTQAYRDANFKDTMADSFDNTAKLTGNIAYTYNTGITGYTPVEVSASDPANHTITVPPVTKTGAEGHGNQYKASMGNAIRYISWTIVLNPDKIAMGGATLTDTLPEWYSLAQDSLVVKEAEITANGAATAIGNEITTGITKSDEGFSFTIPTGENKSYIIAFDTFVTAYHAGMSNEASLSWSGAAQTSTLASGEISGFGAFDEAAYATGVTVPKVQIVKTDAVSGAVLSGAEFKCEPLEYSGGAWVADTSKKTKTGTTNANGILNFTFLKYDTLYKISETNVLAGYEDNTTTSYFFVIRKDDSTTVYPTGTVIFGSDNSTLRKLSITNTKTDAVLYSFSFKKTNAAGNAMSGILFTLSNTANGGAVTAVSANGIVTFENLIPATYTLSETAPTGYTAMADKTLVVTYSGENYSATLDGDNVTADTAIVNTCEYGSARLTKTDMDGVKLSGAEFKVYTAAGTLVGYFAESDVKGEYVLSNTDKNGANAVNAKNACADDYFNVDGKLLTGEYYAVETVAPTGFKLSAVHNNFTVVKDAETTFTVKNSVDNAPEITSPTQTGGETTTAAVTTPAAEETSVTVTPTDYPKFERGEVPNPAAPDAPDTFELVINGVVVDVFHKVLTVVGAWIYIDDDGVPLSEFLMLNPDTGIEFPLGIVFGMCASVLAAIAVKSVKRKEK